MHVFTNVSTETLSPNIATTTLSHICVLVLLFFFFFQHLPGHIIIIIAAIQSTVRQLYTRRCGCYCCYYCPRSVLWCQSVVWLLRVWLLSSNTWQETCRVLGWTVSLRPLSPLRFALSSHIPGLSTYDTCQAGRQRRKVTSHSHLQIRPLILFSPSCFNLGCLQSFLTSECPLSEPKRMIQMSERAMERDEDDRHESPHFY